MYLTEYFAFLSMLQSCQSKLKTPWWIDWQRFGFWSLEMEQAIRGLILQLTSEYCYYDLLNIICQVIKLQKKYRPWKCTYILFFIHRILHYHKKMLKNMFRITILKYSKIILIIIGNILDFRILCLRSKQILLKTRMLESLIIRLVVINLW